MFQSADDWRSSNFIKENLDYLVKNKDYIGSSGIAILNNKEKTIQWSKYNLDETYLEEHSNIFRKKYINLCKVNEALDTLKLIDKIKKNNNQ